jgi:hypothetical protein
LSPDPESGENYFGTSGEFYFGIDNATLQAATEEARAKGVFGSPSFVAGGELYWGNDRLEQALGL